MMRQLKTLKRAVEIDSSYADPYFNLAMVYASVNESEQMITENLKKFLENNQDKSSPSVKIASDKLGIQIQEGSVVDNIKPDIRKPQLLKRRTELEENLGAPSRNIKLLPADDINIYFYPEKGTKLITFGKRDIVVGIIIENKIDSLTTSEVSIGDTKENLLNIYGEPTKITTFGNFSYYLYHGLLFILHGETIRSWVAFNTG